MQTVLESPHLLGGLHVPEFYQAMRPPEGVDEEKWSRAVAMAASNGFRTPHGEVVLLEKTSLFNHSCRPNAAAGGTGGSDIQVRAIKEIKEGQEICICYDSAVYLSPTERRRAFLKDKWGFDCECPRCVADPQDADLIEKLLNSKRHWGDVWGHARLEELFHNLEGLIKV